jgi:hypothetical protein
MTAYPTPSQDDVFVLDRQIGKLKDEIKMLMATIDRLAAGQHDTDDAGRHLDHLLQQYSTLVEIRYLPPPQSAPQRGGESLGA